MKVLLVSTLGHNPGDEIIRLGVEYIVRRHIPDARFRVIHKHDCRTLFAGFQQRRKTPRRLISPVLYRLYASSVGRNKENFLDTSELVIFAGTPFIWRAPLKLLPFTSANAEWVGAVWNRLFNELTEKMVLNLAAGTSVTNREDLYHIYEDGNVVKFLSAAVDRCALTTARDSITREVLSDLGYNVSLIPCASMFAANGAQLPPKDGEYVVINLMPRAAHSWRGQIGDLGKWRNTIKRAVEYIGKRYPIQFVSHSQVEDRTAAEWFPNHPRIFSRNPLDLLRAYSKAIFGLCNRVHAGAAIASFEKPAIVVGGDSRVDLITHFGLPAYDHREVDEARIVDIIADVEANLTQLTETLRDRKRKTEQDYLAALVAAGVPSSGTSTRLEDRSTGTQLG